MVTVPTGFSIPHDSKIPTHYYEDILTLRKNVLYPVGVRREEQFLYLCGSWCCLKLVPLKHIEKPGLEETSGHPKSSFKQGNLQTGCSGPGPNKLWVFSQNGTSTVVLGIWWFHRVFFLAVVELGCAFWISEARNVAVSARMTKRQPKSNCVAGCSGAP